MTPEDVHTLTDWLGPEGAVAGLERSKFTNAELMVLAREAGHIVDKKIARRQLAIELVMSPIKRINKSQEYLLEMAPDEIQRYFADRMVSINEIVRLLEDLGIPPSGKVRGKMSDYAAREIGELGMFQRVAKGAHLKKD